MDQLLQNISLADVKDFFLILAAVIGAYLAIANFGGKIKNKQFEPLTKSLEEIKGITNKLNDQMVLLLKVQMAMAQELETDGEVNGKTQQALDELTDYIVKNINQ